MTDIWQDIRYALRLLLKSFGFTATAVLTIAIAIGANTAVFSVVHGVLLKPLPYPDPDQLVFIWNGIEPSRSDVVNMDGLAELRDHSQSLEAVSAFTSQRLFLEAEGPPEELELVRVSSNLFTSVLRVNPVRGRNFTVDDERLNATPVVILSHEFWQTRYGADPNVIGRIVRLQDYHHCRSSVYCPRTSGRRII